MQLGHHLGRGQDSDDLPRVENVSSLGGPEDVECVVRSLSQQGLPDQVRQIPVQSGQVGVDCVDQVGEHLLLVLEVHQQVHLRPQLLGLLGHVQLVELDVLLGILELIIHESRGQS